MQNGIKVVEQLGERDSKLAALALAAKHAQQGADDMDMIAAEVISAGIIPQHYLDATRDIFTIDEIDVEWDQSFNEAVGRMRELR